MRFIGKQKWTIAALIFMFFGLPGAAAETKLLRYPDIHKNRIVFCYGGDVYTSSITGKNVKRLTDFPGEELLPKFSPDGEQIAFTAEFEGNKDVYVMPAQGGKATRLPYHPAAEFVVDWHPDGKSVIFRSNGSSFSYRFNRLHAVPVQGRAAHRTGTARGGVVRLQRRGRQGRLLPDQRGCAALQKISRRNGACHLDL